MMRILYVATQFIAPRGTTKTPVAAQFIAPEYTPTQTVATQFIAPRGTTKTPVAAQFIAPVLWYNAHSAINCATTVCVGHILAQ